MFIIEFVNNNILLVLIKIIFFFVNKSFYFRISLSLNSTSCILTRERLQTAKIKVITDSIQKILKMINIKVKVVKDIMIMQINNHSVTMLIRR